MSTITFQDTNGQLHPVEGSGGDSLMQVAVRAGVPGIIGECGGEMSCATCHVYVPEAAAEAFPPPSADEEDLLELVDYSRSESRLGCQLSVADAPSNLVVEVAPQ